MQKPPVHAMPEPERTRPRMGTLKRIAIGTVLATGIHGAALTANTWVPAAKRGLEKIEQKYAEYSIRKEREELIAEAKKARREGTFRLGEFILAANRIDAKEKGESFDDFRPLTRYVESYQWRFKMQTQTLGNPVHEALPEALKGVQYLFETKTMAGLLLDRGGNCQPLTHLAVSLLYDAGLGENAYFRVYGGPIGHVTPTYVEDGVEYDLMSGMRAKGGIRMHADELVEAYEKATLADGGSGFAYPKSNEEYPGEIPLFARNAFKQPVEKRETAAAATSYEERRKEAGVGEPEPFPYGTLGDVLWLLDPFPAQWGSGTADFRPQSEKKTEEWLEAFCREIAHTEKKLNTSKDEGGRLLLLSKLGAAYAKAHWEAALLGKMAVSRSAEDKRQETIKRAKELVEKINWKDKERKIKIMNEISTNISLFAFLGTAGEKVLDMHMEDSGSDTYPIAALIAKPSARERGLGVYDKLNPMDRMEVLDILSGQEVRPTINWEFASLGPAVDEILTAYYFVGYGCYAEHPNLEGLEKIVGDAAVEGRLGSMWSDRALSYLIIKSLGDDPRCLSFGVEPKEFKTASPDGYIFLKKAHDWVEGKKDNGLDTLRKRVDGLLENQMSLEEAKRLGAI